ncbi:MAG: UbiA family prenyltransferase [Anaerolineales bacterium]|nr:UbiA family prenyltransferase [Anaerolineales bacterium]
MQAQSLIVNLKSKITHYLPLIKSLQTSLLLLTGVAGYLSADIVSNLSHFWQMIPSLFFAIAGSTILNMWWDQDIDLKMKRTHKRPTSAGLVTSREVFLLGLIVSVFGVGWALIINWLYGLVVFAGLFFDVVIYSMWLKRRTCWSIVWGGISGAMPIIAGRVLAVGGFDLIGITLGLAILLWIPTHTLTYSIKFCDDYKNAGVPTFPETYGVKATRATIATSAVLAALCIGWASILINLDAGLLSAIVVLTAILLVLAFATLRIHTDRMNYILFRYASIYMMSAMVILSLQGFV